ncbi:MAG TPA: 3-oxoacyl-[acyl-carrier-protein] synthase III C-terminal domain-containing protein [Frankiaceae bacterium]|nr:3-oxoacyl-[acyl-carrier-protein] synthase III C-terminal domain-containing protein [Frankiaceae bacterium]
MTVLQRPDPDLAVRPARPAITGFGSAVPGEMDQDGLWRDFFAEHYRTRPVARRIFASAGVTMRHGAVDPRVEDVSGWGTGARMSRYVEEAMPLGRAAVAQALSAAGLAASDVGLFAVVSCTGYSTPGVDILLARDLGMSADVQRLVIGHMGCYAALPGLGAVSDFVAARGRPAVLLCLELTSLHVQPATADLGQVVAHALFADAAAALVLEPGRGPQPPAGTERRRPLRVRDVVAVTDPSTSDHMTWDVTDLGFRMGLSPRVPAVLQRHVGSVVRDRLLAPHGLTPADVSGWAVHPGGRRILEVVAEQLELSAAAMAPSYEVLAQFGNCSSATVLLVLDRLPDEPGPVVAMAFGPGLTLYAALLERA